MKKNKTVVGVHDFDWLYTQVHDESTREFVDWIIKVEKSYMRGDPLPVGTDLMKLQLGENTIWTRQNTSHSIPYGYVQIFKLLDEILPHEFRQPMQSTIVDVGANEGHWSLFMALRHPEAHIICIEPNPVPLELMRKNIESNKSFQAEVLPVAIGDTNGAVEFETIANVTSLGSFKIDRTGRPWLTDEKIKKISVQCHKIDDLSGVQDATFIDLLKIDVEGTEVAVLKGAEQTLCKTKRIEIEYGTRQNKEKILEILEVYGFELLLDHPYSEGRGDLFLYKS